MRTRYALLAATLIVGSVGIAVAPNALGQDTSGYDPSQLPTIKGKVAEYSLTPRGDVDGLILNDGTEIHLPPHLGTQLVYAVKPGDEVTIHGLRARAIPMVQAVSISNDASGTTITNSGAGSPPGPHSAQQTLTAEGRIKFQLHGPAGDLNGVLLEDGTIVRLPPLEAQRLAAELSPNAPLYVRGTGNAGPLGRVIAAWQIGPNPNSNHLVRIAVPPSPGLLRALSRFVLPPAGSSINPPLPPGPDSGLNPAPVPGPAPG